MDCVSNQTKGHPFPTAFKKHVLFHQYYASDRYMMVTYPSLVHQGYQWVHYVTIWSQQSFELISPEKYIHLHFYALKCLISLTLLSSQRVHEVPSPEEALSSRRDEAKRLGWNLQPSCCQEGAKDAGCEVSCISVGVYVHRKRCVLLQVSVETGFKCWQGLVIMITSFSNPKVQIFFAWKGTLEFRIELKANISLYSLSPLFHWHHHPFTPLPSPFSSSSSHFPHPSWFNVHLTLLPSSLICDPASHLFSGVWIVVHLSASPTQAAL